MADPKVTEQPSESNFDGGTMPTNIGGMSGTTRLFKDILSADTKRMSGYTPLVTGRGFLIITKMPEYMKVAFGDQINNTMKNLYQFYIKGVDGFVDKTLVTSKIETGIESTEIDIATSIQGATQELTLNFGPELQGGFISKYHRNWITGIVDPNTHDAHYHGALDKVIGGFAQQNHVMEAIYFTTDPSRTRIESTALIVNMMPKLGALSFMNYTQGEHNLFNPSIPFTCQVFENNKSIGRLLYSADILKYFGSTKTYDVAFNHITYEDVPSGR